MKKLFYIANIRMPTERAHGIQVAYMCSSFARQMRRPNADLTQTDAEKDNSVTLMVPDRDTLSEDPFEYYGVERNFTIEKIPVPDTVRFGRLGFLLESLVFSWRAARWVKKSLILSAEGRIRRGGNPLSLTTDAVIYTREELPFLFLPRGHAFYEAHQLRRSSFFKRLIRRARGVIAITQGLKDAFVQAGIFRERMLVAHDGYDEKQFAARVNKEEARRRLSLPVDRKVALYIGGLEPWKGAETLCKAAVSLAQDNILIAMIGGTEKEIKRLQKDYPDALFLGARPYRELPQHQQAADVLVIPNSAQEEISRSFTSPLKLFAHMSSGVPIVASRLPSLLEILSEKNAYLVEPDDPSALAVGILAALRNSAESTTKAKKAAVDVAAYSWDKRAENVLSYIRWLGEKKSS